MKLKFFILIFSLSFTSSFSQNELDSAFKKTNMPQFEGGKNALEKFITQNLKLPTIYTDDNSFKLCKVLVKFIVDETGKIIEPQIAKGCFGFDLCDKEALRIMAIMPLWIPAKKDNKPVKRSYSLSFDFEKK